MKPYNVQVQVTTTYTVEVHAEDEHEVADIAWAMDLDEMEAQGSVDGCFTTNVGNIEEIYQESEEDE